ncbi:MAG: hypothetical protein DRJ02_10555 [Bacteroidetes bacterium]|nr:MAG: hypothetical protein DRJ02_10555 [Bacteroidota bacterium]
MGNKRNYILPFLFFFIFLLFQGQSFAQSDSTLIQTDTIISVTDSTIILTDTISNTDSIPLNVKPPPPPPPKVPEMSKADSLRVSYFLGTLDSLKLKTFHPIDTAILRYHQYDPQRYGNLYYSTLSNIGMAGKNFIFKPHISNGYDMRTRSFSKYMYYNSDVKYYQQVIPYSDIHYVMGPKKEQSLYVVFSRELYRGLSVGIDFGIVYSPGEYKNSKSNNNKLFITGQYYTPNKRYGVIANYLRDRILVRENGGITYDSIFELNLKPDRGVIPVNLEDDENLIIQSGFYVEQYFNLLKPRSATDTTRRKIDAGNISYAFHYQRNKKVYSGNDPLDDFYKPYAPPIDSLNTFDSLYQLRIRNTVKWSNAGYSDAALSDIFTLSFGVHYDYLEQTLPYDSVKSIMNQVIPFGGISLKLFRSSFLTASAHLVLGDYNGGDFAFRANLKQFLGTESRNFGRLSFTLDLTSQMPSWFYSEYQSNRFRWKNNMNKEGIMHIKGSYFYKFFETGINFTTYSNYTYLNDSVRPEQLKTTATIFQVFAQGNIPIKKFGIDTRLVYQVPSNASIIRMPMFVGMANLYFRSSVFKKAATLQTGFQLSYFTEYYADAYMPELRSFYLQNEKKIGNYIYVDVYITLEVKRARLFAKYSHLNSYFGNYTYYLAPHYPARDARFYFGVAWRFHD